MDESLNSKTVPESLVASVSVRCCSNCKNFKCEPANIGQPYPEIYCSKNHWCGVSDSEEAKALDKPFECSDFNAH